MAALGSGQMPRGQRQHGARQAQEQHRRWEAELPGGPPSGHHRGTRPPAAGSACPGNAHCPGCWPARSAASLAAAPSVMCSGPGGQPASPRTCGDQHRLAHVLMAQLSGSLATGSAGPSAPALAPPIVDRGLHRHQLQGPRPTGPSGSAAPAAPAAPPHLPAASDKWGCRGWCAPPVPPEFSVLLK